MPISQDAIWRLIVFRIRWCVDGIKATFGWGPMHHPATPPCFCAKVFQWKCKRKVVGAPSDFGSKQYLKWQSCLPLLFLAIRKGVVFSRNPASWPDEVEEDEGPGSGVLDLGSWAPGEGLAMLAMGCERFMLRWALHGNRRHASVAPRRAT